MDTNHKFSRPTSGWISPKFRVIYRAGAQNDDPELETVFDAPESIVDRFFGKCESLPDSGDRMKFVGEITRDFDRLMTMRKSCMEGELSKIARWVAA